MLELTLSPSLRDVLIADRELPSAIVMLDLGSFNEDFGFYSDRERISDMLVLQKEPCG